MFPIRTTTTMLNLKHPAHSLIPYALVSLITAVMGLIFMFACGIWPLGDQVFSFLDNNQGMAPTIGSLLRILEGTESLNWTFFSCGAARTSLLASYHCLFFPTTWLACLLPHGNCTQAMSWIFLLQLLLCSVSCLFYLRRTFRFCPDFFQILLAISYTFSQFLFTKFTFLPFLNIAGLFPLFLYSLDLILKRKRYAPYLLISVYMSAAAPYFFWMWGIFTVVYSAARMGIRWDRRSIVPLFVLGGVTLLAVGIATCIWLPSCIVTLSTSRMEMSTNSNWCSQLIRFPLFSPWMLTPLFLCMLALPHMHKKRIIWSRYGITLLVLVLAVVVVPFNNIWHMGPPIEFPVRFSYMLSMMSCCVGAMFFSSPPAKAPKFCTQGPHVFVLLVSVGVSVFVCYYLFIHEGMSNLRHIKFGIKALWVIALIPSTLIFYRLLLKSSTFFLMLLLALAFILHYHEEMANHIETIPERAIDAELAGKSVRKALTSPWARLKSMDLCYLTSHAELSGINSFSNFFHTSNKTQQTTIQNLGYLIELTRISDCGGSIFSDSFLGCELIADRHGILAPLAECITPDDACRVYRNPYYWGDGLLLSTKGSAQQEEWGDNPFEVQQTLFEELGGEGELFEKLPAELSMDDEGTVRISYQTMGKDWLYMDSGLFSAEYFFIPWYYCRQATLYPNGQRGRKLMIQLPTTGGRAEHTVVLAKPHWCAPLDSIERFHEKQVCIYRLNTENLNRLAEKHRGTVRVTDIKGRTLKVEVYTDATGQVLLLPYFYRKEYSATDDKGNTLALFPYHNMTAMHLQGEGKHLVTLRYTPPLQTAASLISIFFTASTLFFACWNKSRGRLFIPNSDKWCRRI